MTEEQVTIKVKADTSEYSAGMREAGASNKEFRAEAQKIADDVKKGWSKATDGISDGAKDMGKSLKGSKISESFKGLAGKGVIEAIKVGLKGLVAGVAVVAVKAMVEAMRGATALFDTGLAEKQANKMNSAFLKVKTTIGAIISPLYTIATEILTHIANAINTILESLLTVTGYVIGLVGAMGVLSRSATDYAEGMEEATAAASAGLAGFDKLTTIDTSGMGDEAQAQRIRDMMADAAESGNVLRGTIAETLNPLTLIGNFFANIGLERQWEGFTRAATTSWDTVSQLGGQVWTVITKWAVGSWDRYVESATIAWNTISSTGLTVWGALTTSFSQTAQEWLAPVLAGATNLSNIINGAIDGLLSFDMSATWVKVSDGFGVAWGTVSASITTTVDTISTTLTGIWDTVSATVSTSIGSITTTIDSITASLTGVWDNISSIVSTSMDTITTSMTGVWDSFTSTVSTTIGHVTTTLTGVWDTFTSTASTSIDTITTTLTDVWGSFTDTASTSIGHVSTTLIGVWDTFTMTAGDTLSTVWGSVSSGFTTMWTGVVSFAGQTFDTIFTPLMDNTRGVFAGIASGVHGLIDTIVSGLSQIPDRMASIFTRVWDGMTSGFKTVANGIIKIFNKVIGAYNSTLGQMNVDVLGHEIGFSTIGEIPMLAQGGIAEPNDPFLAVLGDNRKEREFITPESTMRDVVRSVIEEQGGVRQTIEIPISLDGRAIARATYDYYSRESKRRGTSWL